MKRQQKGGHLEAQEKGLRGMKPASTLILNFQPPNYEEINFCWLKPLSLWSLLWQP